MTSCKTKRGGMGRALDVTSAAKNSFERLIIVLQNFISVKKFIAVKKLLFESESCNKSCHKKINQISILTIHTTLDCYKLTMLINNDFKIIVSSLKTTLAKSIAEDIKNQLVYLEQLMVNFLVFEKDEYFDDVNRKRLEDAYFNVFNKIVEIEVLLFELKNLMEQDSSVLSSLTDKTDITEDLKQKMVDLLDRNLQLLSEVTFPSIAMSVEPFISSHGDILKTFDSRIKKEQEDNPERVSRQQSLLRARRDAREQGRSVSPPIGFEYDTGEYEDPPFEYPEKDDPDREYALIIPEKGRGRKSRKRNTSTRMFKKHKKQKKQILTTRKRNKIRTSTRRG
jgi:hypothetical protein